MARRSLKPQLNQIRAWVQEGRTDAWIAHQLEISTSELREFRKQHDLTPDDEGAGSAEVDLRDEIEAEIEAATVEEDEPEEEDDEAEDEDEDEGEDEEPEAKEKPEKRERPKRARKEAKKPDEGDEPPSGTKKPGRRRRRRGRRGGRGRRKELEATFDHGERDGYGLWLDPAVKDNQVYSEHWAGKREVTVRIEADQIVIRRAGEPGGGSPSDNSDD